MHEQCSPLRMPLVSLASFKYLVTVFNEPSLSIFTQIGVSNGWSRFTEPGSPFCQRMSTVCTFIGTCKDGGCHFLSYVNLLSHFFLYIYFPFSSTICLDALNHVPLQWFVLDADTNSIRFFAMNYFLFKLIFLLA